MTNVWSRLAAALLTIVALIGLFGTSLAPPSGTEEAEPPAELPIELADDDAATLDEPEPLVTFESSALVPEALVEIEEGDEADTSTATIDSGDLGIGDTITILRPAGVRTIDVAVADDLVFTSFNTTLVVPSAVHEVQVEMSIGTGVVFSAIVPGGSTEQLSFTLDEPIADDTTLTISVEERFAATCTSTVVESSALRMIDNEFVFERVAKRPETIADFFPPVMEHLIVVVDPDADSSVRSAAFELGTALARRYPSMPEIDVIHRPLPGTRGADAEGVDRPTPVRDDPFSRTIVLDEGDEASMSVRQGVAGAHLEIVGPPGLLEEMAAAVSARELAFVTKPSVKVEELMSDVAETDLLAQRSLRDVGVRRLSTSGSRVLQLPINLPQAAFGEPIDEIRVRLGGVTVASGTSGRDPILTLWLNDDLQDVIEYDSSGRFDLEFVISADQIGRDNQLLIRSELPLECGDELPNHELTLDAASWVDADPGQSLPMSLDRFPQVAIGHLSVAAGETEQELALAMTMVGVLQGSSPLDIHPQAAPVERILAGFSSGLVVTNGQGEVAEAMARDLTTVRADQLALVSGDRPDDLAFLSTSITDTDQDILVLFSPTERLSDAFSEVAIERTWSELDGWAVGVRGSGDVVTSGITAAEQEAAALMSLEAPPEQEPSVARQFGLGALAALLLVAGVLALRFVLGAVRRLR